MAMAVRRSLCFFEWLRREPGDSLIRKTVTSTGKGTWFVNQRWMSRSTTRTRRGPGGPGCGLSRAKLGGGGSWGGADRGGAEGGTRVDSWQLADSR